MSVINAQLIQTGMVPTNVGNSTSPAQQLPTISLIETNDTLATVLTTGYLNSSERVFGYVYNNNQMALVYTTDSGPVWLKVVVTNGPVFSLAYPASVETNALTKTGTLTVGDLIKVQNASGVMQDAGIAANALATYTGATVIGNLVKASSVAGQVQDAAIAATNLMLLSAINQMGAGAEVLLDKAAGSASSGTVVINKQSGVITTASLTTAAQATTSITLTNSLIAANSVILPSLMGGTNTTPGVQLSAVAGVGSATINITNNNAAAVPAALNGTLFIGFAVF